MYREITMNESRFPCGVQRKTCREPWTLNQFGNRNQALQDTQQFLLSSGVCLHGWVKPDFQRQRFFVKIETQTSSAGLLLPNLLLELNILIGNLPGEMGDEGAHSEGIQGI